jgi:flagellar assembly protein FliH
VAAEEKKSLPKAEEIGAGQDHLHLHYFPNIPMGNAAMQKRCMPIGPRFKRTYFSSEDCPCPDSLQDADEAAKAEEAARAEISQIEENAYQRGFQDGQKIGYESGAEKAKPVVESMRHALDRLENARKDMHLRLEKEVVALALAIAKKVICHEVTINKEVVVCVAREALQQVENPEEVRVKMSPGDLKYLQDMKEQLLDLTQNIENIRFEAEASIPSGGCIVETNFGRIDARIERQLQVVEESFHAELDKLQLKE